MCLCRALITPSSSLEKAVLFALVAYSSGIGILVATPQAKTTMASPAIEAESQQSEAGVASVGATGAKDASNTIIQVVTTPQETHPNGDNIQPHLVNEDERMANNEITDCETQKQSNVSSNLENNGQLVQDKPTVQCCATCKSTHECEEDVDNPGIYYCKVCWEEYDATLNADSAELEKNVLPCEDQELPQGTMNEGQQQRVVQTPHAEEINKMDNSDMNSAGHNIERQGDLPSQDPSLQFNTQPETSQTQEQPSQSIATNKTSAPLLSQPPTQSQVESQSQSQSLIDSQENYPTHPLEQLQEKSQSQSLMQPQEESQEQPQLSLHQNLQSPHKSSLHSQVLVQSTDPSQEQSQSQPALKIQPHPQSDGQIWNSLQQEKEHDNDNDESGASKGEDANIINEVNDGKDISTVMNHDVSDRCCKDVQTASDAATVDVVDDAGDTSLVEKKDSGSNESAGVDSDDDANGGMADKMGETRNRNAKEDEGECEDENENGDREAVVSTANHLAGVAAAAVSVGDNNVGTTHSADDGDSSQANNKGNGNKSDVSFEEGDANDIDETVPSVLGLSVENNNTNTVFKNKHDNKPKADTVLGVAGDVEAGAVDDDTRIESHVNANYKEEPSMNLDREHSDSMDVNTNHMNGKPESLNAYSRTVAGINRNTPIDDSVLYDKMGSSENDSNDVPKGCNSGVNILVNDGSSHVNKTNCFSGMDVQNCINFKDTVGALAENEKPEQDGTEPQNTANTMSNDMIHLARRSGDQQNDEVQDKFVEPANKDDDSMNIQNSTFAFESDVVDKSIDEADDQHGLEDESDGDGGEDTWMCTQEMAVPNRGLLTQANSFSSEEDNEQCSLEDVSTHRPQDLSKHSSPPHALSKIIAFSGPCAASSAQAATTKEGPPLQHSLADNSSQFIQQNNLSAQAALGNDLVSLDTMEIAPGESTGQFTLRIEDASYKESMPMTKEIFGHSGSSTQTAEEDDKKSNDRDSVVKNKKKVNKNKDNVLMEDDRGVVNKAIEAVIATQTETDVNETDNTSNDAQMKFFSGLTEASQSQSPNQNKNFHTEKQESEMKLSSPTKENDAVCRPNGEYGIWNAHSMDSSTYQGLVEDNQDNGRANEEGNSYNIKDVTNDANENTEKSKMIRTNAPQIQHHFSSQTTVLHETAKENIRVDEGQVLNNDDQNADRLVDSLATAGSDGCGWSLYAGNTQLLPSATSQTQVSTSALSSALKNLDALDESMNPNKAKAVIQGLQEKKLVPENDADNACNEETQALLANAAGHYRNAASKDDCGGGDIAELLDNYTNDEKDIKELNQLKKNSDSMHNDRNELTSCNDHGENSTSVGEFDLSPALSAKDDADFDRLEVGGDLMNQTPDNGIQPMISYPNDHLEKKSQENNCLDSSCFINAEDTSSQKMDEDNGACSQQSQDLLASSPKKDATSANNSRNDVTHPEIHAGMSEVDLVEASIKGTSPPYKSTKLNDFVDEKNGPTFPEQTTMHPQHDAGTTNWMSSDRHIRQEDECHSPRLLLPAFNTSEKKTDRSDEESLFGHGGNYDDSDFIEDTQSQHAKHNDQQRLSDLKRLSRGTSSSLGYCDGSTLEKVPRNRTHHSNASRDTHSMDKNIAPKVLLYGCAKDQIDDASSSTSDSKSQPSSNDDDSENDPVGQDDFEPSQTNQRVKKQVGSKRSLWRTSNGYCIR